MDIDTGVGHPEMAHNTLSLDSIQPLGPFPNTIAYLFRKASIYVDIGTFLFEWFGPYLGCQVADGSANKQMKNLMLTCRQVGLFRIYVDKALQYGVESIVPGFYSSIPWPAQTRSRNQGMTLL